MTITAQAMVSRILLVEDSPGDQRLTTHALRSLLSPIPEIDIRASMAAALEAIASNSYDIILTDLDLPDSFGLATCKQLAEAATHIPVVVLTGSHSEELGLDALHMGAQDYLIKDEYRGSELRRVLRHALERHRMRTSLVKAKSEVEEALGRLRTLEEMREQLTHMLVHDLRSPTFGIRLYLEGLIQDAERAGDTTHLKELQTVYALAGQLVEMVGSILDVNRIESNQMPLSMTRVDLHRIADEAVTLITGGVRRSLIVNQVPAGEVMCDATLIKRVIGNLLSNAIRFSPADRTVTISGERRAGEIEISVQDLGRGIPATFQQRIFEKFGSLDASAKGYSTGLGLPFCKIAVEAHHGSIGVRSSETLGSTFWFTLPI